MTGWDAFLSIFSAFCIGFGLAVATLVPGTQANHHRDQRVICEYQHNKWIDNKCYSQAKTIDIHLPK